MTDLNHTEMNQHSEIKRCSDCGTSKTPLWRGGPAGPKSLCNACGIRSRKKRRAILGEEKKGRKKSGGHLHQRLVELGMVERSRVENRSKFGEEEEAALLLMALSYGSVYA